MNGAIPPFEDMCLIICTGRLWICIKFERDLPICDGSVSSQDSPLRCVVNKVELWMFFFLRVLWFSLLISLQRCSVGFLLLSRGRKSEP